MTRMRILDVSGLEPPEPMKLVLATLPCLAPGELLVFRHRHAPVPLYPLLEQLGFAWRERVGRETPIEVLIWRAGAELPPDLP